MPQPKKALKPISVSGLTAKVYERGNGKFLCVVPTPDGKRRHITGLDLAKVRAKAREIMVRLTSGGSEWDAMTAEQRRVAKEAVRLGLTVEDLGRLAARPVVRVDDAAKRFLKEAGAKVRKSERYMRDLRGRINAFAADFADSVVADVSASDISDWLEARSDFASTQDYHRQALVTFWRWCRRVEIVADGMTAADRVARPEWERGEVGIFSPAQFRELLSHVRADYLPWALLSGFAGIRVGELFGEVYKTSPKRALEWSDIDLGDDPHIYLPNATAKTVARVVPICATLKEWLLPIAGSGRICPSRAASYAPAGAVSETIRLCGRLGLAKWPQNALRHSFGTYRTAETGDLSRVALEMGNSPAVIRRHYLKGSTAAVAHDWFGAAMRATGCRQ